ncbi:hypothetical protein [Pseudodesulfovibrio methanolicus]|uniref:Uncharacterized protein n=1 Tax=Pseudodesulfovibrio methanolicus TaxID=3126690 RepID=A0ABZ2ISQ7_9BACT
MRLDSHINSTYKQIGQDFRQIHIEIDKYFVHFRSSLHWVILHHQLGIELLVERFGEEARRSAEIHIRDDFAVRNFENEVVEEGFTPIGPIDPRLLERVNFLGPRDLEYADEILEELYGKKFDLEAAFD